MEGKKRGKISSPFRRPTRWRRSSSNGNALARSFPRFALNFHRLPVVGDNLIATGRLIDVINPPCVWDRGFEWISSDTRLKSIYGRVIFHVRPPRGFKWPRKNYDGRKPVDRSSSRRRTSALFDLNHFYRVTGHPRVSSNGGPVRWLAV